MISIEATPIAERLAAFADLQVPAQAVDAARSAPPDDDRALIAFSREVLPAARAIEGVRREGKPIVLGHLEPEELHEFAPIPAVDLPASDVYLLVDVDLGADSRNVTPEAALADILARGRSPLTIEEGIAVILQQPGAIATNWGFSMAGSRRSDQRVPAFWVSEKKPKLGWCWDRNPHTWLGTASCAARLPV